MPIVTKNFATVGLNEFQLHLWHNTKSSSLPPALQPTFDSYYDRALGDEREKGTYFISAVPNGTLTGVLREHAMRLNSSVGYEEISPDAYPPLCDGNSPFHYFVQSTRPVRDGSVCSRRSGIFAVESDPQ